MDSKIKEQLEAYCREHYQKLVESLTELSMNIFSDLYTSLPDIMSDKDKLEFIKCLIDGQINNLVGSTESLDTKKMQVDMENKLKEQVNG